MSALVATDAEEEDLKTHVRVCAIRYEGINGRLKRIENIILTGTGAIIAALSAIAWAVATK